MDGLNLLCQTKYQKFPVLGAGRPLNNAWGNLCQKTKKKEAVEGLSAKYSNT